MPWPKGLKRPEDQRKRISDAMKIIRGTKEARKRQSDISKKWWDDPTERKKRCDNIKRVRGTKEARNKTSEISKTKWKSAETRKLHKNSLKKANGTPEARKRQSDISKKWWVDRRWYGNVTYYDHPVYCELWTDELRERVREFFGRVCVECGQTEGKKKLHVHHVWYDKKVCCNDNPRRSLVSLCEACHAKTTAKKDREYWSAHFQEMIDTYYGGKCWLTKEEFAALKRRG